MIIANLPGYHIPRKLPQSPGPCLWSTSRGEPATHAVDESKIARHQQLCERHARWLCTKDAP